ncbi:MAG: hypothetical protein EXX96DRAFT_459066, partial [Benjaminiella poitrasii]
NRRKSVPHRSPSTLTDHKSIVFQLNKDCTPKILGADRGLLWSLRQRVSMARHHTPSSSSPLPVNPMQPRIHKNRLSASLPAASRRKTSHASSGRPSRVKGPCQACHETSDGCMRKAFDWPFPTSTIFNDKGKPFVYLCNKCGLRYNKSGGCVCRHCRWVLCKEEKRKAMQLIDQMRRTRPDGRIDPDEDIENFICTPKYWNCGHPWKVGWVLHSQHDEDDED